MSLRLRVLAGVCLLLWSLGAVRGARASELAAAAQAAARCDALEGCLVRSTEPGARLELAECYAQLGRNASAWAQYREAAKSAQNAGRPELETLARARAKALEPELSYVTVSVWKNQPVHVAHDGTAIDDSVLGTAIPLDPGRHVISASATGKRGWTHPIELGSHGDHVRVAVPVLPDAVEPLGPALGPTAPMTAAGSALETSVDPSLQRTLGLVAGALGIAGVATGTLFGVKAAADWSDARAACRSYPYCGAEGARRARDAKNSAWVSTLGFATGVVGLSGGALLWFTAQSEERSAPALGVGVGHVLLRGPL